MNWNQLNAGIPSAYLQRGAMFGYAQMQEATYKQQEETSKADYNIVTTPIGQK